MDWQARWPTLRPIVDRIRLPVSCVVCGCLSDTEDCLCTVCESTLPWITRACPGCAISLPAIGSTVALCGQCIKPAPILDHCQALMHYETPARQLITTFKFHRGLAEGRVLGTLLGRKMKDHYAGSNAARLLIPVPLHRRRLRDRGFNQAVELARRVEFLADIPMAATVIDRVLDTPSQRELPARQRIRNLNGAFRVRNPELLQRFQKVIIIDDVMTTLSTIQSLTLTIKAAGVPAVDAWAIARVTPGRQIE